MKIVRPPNPDPRFFHLHAHSNFSINDALGPVDQMVATAVTHDQPALALTDHGNMGGAVQLYTHAAKAGVLPFPGLEAYVVESREDKKAKRHHLGLVAYTTPGYVNLVALSSMSHTREYYHHKPLVDFVDLAELAQQGRLEGIAATSGCFFGFVQQALATHNEPRARQLCKMFDSWFDPFLIEVQNHHIEDEDHSDAMLVEALFAMAHDLGIPAVITQDAHYCHASDLMTHRALKQLVAWGPDPDDAVFPGDSFHLASTRWVKEHYTEAQWEQGMQGLSWLTEHHDLSIPQLDRYQYNVPATVSDPTTTLREFVLEQMAEHGICTDDYLDRFEDEMGVIADSGMAGYLWLVKEVCDWCRDNDVLYQTRGSASGSLVCWMLGITQLDPLKWKLRFERFLSRDRTKPPDIDLDVEDERRDDLIAMLSQRFAVRQIGTYGTFSVDEKTGRGSLLVSYLSKQRKLGANVDHIQGLADIPVEDQQRMRRLSEYKVKKSAGTHAAGLVVATDRSGLDFVPTMLIPSSNTTVTQFTGDDVEAMGLMKLDILGLTNLSTIRRACQLLGKPIEPDQWVPLRDARTMTMLRRGLTTGVFQLDGWTASRGCREMQVRKVEDIIALMALYRPAVMNSGATDTYNARKAGNQRTPVYDHPLLAEITGETYSLFVYQEQVIAVLRGIGMDPEDLTTFLKAVKASNKDIGSAGDVIDHYYEMYCELAVTSGFTNSEIAEVWDAIKGFAEYGFNRAHATRYGIRAYQGAYLKCHHPLEFYTALLQTSSGDKEREIMKEVSGAGIRLLKPDVNVSTEQWTLDRKAQGIRQGLTTIKGVGLKAASELVRHAPFTSLQDLATRCDARAVTGAKAYLAKQEFKGVLDKLNRSGALRSVKVNDPFEGAGHAGA